MKGNPPFKDLKERLRWMFEHHIEEYARRLEEIGGPGVGGTELRYSPPMTEKAETKEEIKLTHLKMDVQWLLDISSIVHLINIDAGVYQI